MGSFYLDIIKDRQYTTPAESLPRRSAQTALYHIIEAMVRWIAPILSFTAEEIWRYLPGSRGASVFLERWYEGLVRIDASDPFGPALWDSVLAVREAVSKELERLRVGGDIGSSLDAEVALYCEDELREALAAFEDELRFVLITSYARVVPLQEAPAHAVNSETPLGLKLVCTPSSYAKCARCWHHREDVGSSAEHPALCRRCVMNIVGPGEIRRYA
jgi:isoleucyl-tRNA synthetase